MEQKERCVNMPKFLPRCTVTAYFLMSWEIRREIDTPLCQCSAGGSYAQLGKRHERVLEVLPRNKGLFGWTIVCGCKKHLFPLVFLFWWSHWEQLWPVPASVSELLFVVSISQYKKVDNRMTPYATFFNTECFKSYSISCHLP